MSWWDEDDRLVIRTSTQVPFHVRRMVAPLLGLPVKKIRVVKPRIGGGFGGKQEMLIEDLCAHLTIATGRPVRFEYTREQEFTSSRSRHPQRIVFKAGFKHDPAGGAPMLHALRHYVLGNTGAYGTHGLTVQTVTGFRGLSHLSRAEWRVRLRRGLHQQAHARRVPRLRRTAGPVRPRTPHGGSGAVAGRGPDRVAPQDWVKVGDPLPLAKAMGEGREGFAQIIKTCGLEECFAQALAAIGWEQRNEFGGKDLVIDPQRPMSGAASAWRWHARHRDRRPRHGRGVDQDERRRLVQLLVGATDLGTGSDTVLAQIAAETLGVPLDEIIMYSSDTDFTPFDTGAYASSTTYITGGAAKKAAEEVREQIKEWPPRCSIAERAC